MYFLVHICLLFNKASNRRGIPASEKSSRTGVVSSLLNGICQKLTCVVQYNKMAAKAKVLLKLLDVFEDLNNFVDMNGSIYRSGDDLYKLSAFYQILYHKCLYPVVYDDLLIKYCLIQYIDR